MKNIYKVLIAIFANLLVVVGYAQPFYDANYYNTYGIGNDLGLGKMIELPNGKILMVGTAGNGMPLNNDSLILFNDKGGVENLAFYVTPFKGYALAMQGNNKIILAGGNQAGSFAVSRLNLDGTLDNTFGTNGTATINVRADSVDVAHSLYVLSNGQILVGGASGNQAAIIRLTVNGTLDNSFGNGGISIVTTSGTSFNEIGLQSNGSIIALGGGLFRFTANGQLDNTFANNGYLSSGGRSFGILPNDKIIVTGTTGGGFGITLLTVWGYNSNGSVDNAFATAGVFTYQLYPCASGNCTNLNEGGKVIIQQDGKIVIAGSSFFFDGSTGIVPQTFPMPLRLLSDGTLDATATEACTFCLGDPGVFARGNSFYSNVEDYVTDAILLKDGGILYAFNFIGSYKINITSIFKPNVYPSVCSGSSISVPVNIDAFNTYLAGNIFIAELSDSSGSFENPIALGTLSSTGSDTISANIPANIPAGNHYRIRIKSSNPVSYSPKSDYLTVASSFTPSAAIQNVSGFDLCPPINHIFNGTANVINAGENPSYQWKVNNNNVGSNANTYMGSSINLGDTVRFAVNSSLICASPSSVTSDAVVFRAVSATASPGFPINSGTTVNFSSHLSYDVFGGSFQYQWQKNGNNVGSDTSSYTTANLVNGDQIRLIVSYSNIFCDSITFPVGTDTSNTITVTVNTVNLANISGDILTETNKPVRSVTLTASGSPNVTATGNVNGQYIIPLQSGSNYVITPSKNNDTIFTNGVSVSDVVLLQRHIAQIDTLGSPYKIIAADVDNNSLINNNDELLVRELILENISTFPGNRLWSFVTSNHTFSNPYNPFPYPKSRTYANVSSVGNQDYIGIKLGDFNDNYNPLLAKMAGLEFATGQASVAPQGTILVPIRVKNFKNISGFQFTLSWDESVLQFQDVMNGSLAVSYGDNSVSQGQAILLWTEPNISSLTLADSTIVFYVKYKAVGNDGQFSAIEINSGAAPVEVVDKDVQNVPVDKIEGTIVIDQSVGLQEISNAFKVKVHPNPYNMVGSLKVTIPEEQQLNVSISNVTGQVVLSTQKVFTAGENTLDINGGLAPGTYMVKVHNEKYNTTLKLVCVR